MNDLRTTIRRWAAWFRSLFVRRVPDFYHAEQTGVRVCEALGIDSRSVHRLEIVIEPDSPVTVHVESYVDGTDADALVKCLKTTYVEAPGDRVAEAVQDQNDLGKKTLAPVKRTFDVAAPEDWVVDEVAKVATAMACANFKVRPDRVRETTVRPELTNPKLWVVEVEFANLDPGEYSRLEPEARP